MELLKGLLQITGLADPGRRQLEVRRDQAQNRLDWLNSPANNFPEDKFTVFPDLREYLEQHHTWETVSVHSNSVNDPLELPPNISESESEEGTPYQRSDPILQRAVDRLVKSGQVVRTKKGIELSASSQEALARKDLSVPQLPERLRGGSRVAPSSPTAASSSTDPAPVFLRLTPKSVPKSAPKFLKPTPKSLPSTSARTSSDSQTVVVVEEDTQSLLDHPTPVASEVTFRNLSTEDLDRLQLQAYEGQCSVARARAAISWDHHQVLDTFRHSNRRVSRDSGGIYPRETQDVLGTVRQLPNIKIAQVVLSYCHLEDAVRKVLRSASNQSELAGTFISRKPTGPLGKLAVLQELVSLDSLVYHVDDSPEVLGEIDQFIKAHPQCAWKVVGISVPGKRTASGVSYYRNVAEALSAILEDFWS